MKPIKASPGSLIHNEAMSLLANSEHRDGSWYYEGMQLVDDGGPTKWLHNFRSTVSKSHSIGLRSEIDYEVCKAIGCDNVVVPLTGQKDRFCGDCWIKIMDCPACRVRWAEEE